MTSIMSDIENELNSVLNRYQKKELETRIQELKTSKTTSGLKMNSKIRLILSLDHQ